MYSCPACFTKYLHNAFDHMSDVEVLVLKVFSWIKVSNAYLLLPSRHQKRNTCWNRYCRLILFGLTVVIMPMQSTKAATGAYCGIDIVGDLFFKRSHPTGQCSFDSCK